MPLEVSIRETNLENNDVSVYNEKESGEVLLVPVSEPSSLR